MNRQATNLHARRAMKPVLLSWFLLLTFSSSALSSPLRRASGDSVLDYCGTGLGAEIEGYLPATSFNGSNSIFSTHSHGRLYGNGGWCTLRNPGKEYLQVDLGSVRSVCAVATQGSFGFNAWTTSYQLEHSVDGDSWQMITEDGKTKTFNGNTDAGTAVKRSLPSQIIARYVRFYIVQHNSWPCLRVEIYGGEHSSGRQDIETTATAGAQERETTSSTAASVASGGASSTAAAVETIAASTTADLSCINGLGASFGGYLSQSSFIASASIVYLNPYNGRLDGPFGWAPASNPKDEYLQVDLGTVKNVCSMATQGCRTFSFWVTKYQISYSEDVINFEFVMDGGKRKIFQGNSDHESTVTQQLPSPIKARYVRFHPKTYNRHPCLRVELYGGQSVEGSGF